MILYTNGDYHTAAAEAVNNYAFAEDDRKYWAQARRPHPDNLKVSWSTVLAGTLKMSHQTDAESASSNARIIRTTKEWIDKTKDTVLPTDVLMIIQWSTWEREEWEHEGTYYQVNASGIDDVPEELQEKYKEFIANVDWDEKTETAFQEVFDFHVYLRDLGYKHILFNGNNTFFDIPSESHYDYKESYIDPYLPEGSYDGWLQLNGYNTVITSNYHYGAEAHAAWAKRVLKFILEHKIV